MVAKTRFRSVAVYRHSASSLSGAGVWSTLSIAKWRQHHFFCPGNHSIALNASTPSQEELVAFLEGKGVFRVCCRARLHSLRTESGQKCLQCVLQHSLRTEIDQRVSSVHSLRAEIDQRVSSVCLAVLKQSVAFLEGVKKVLIASYWRSAVCSPFPPCQALENADAPLSQMFGRVFSREK